MRRAGNKARNNMSKRRVTIPVLLLVAALLISGMGNRGTAVASDISNTGGPDHFGYTWSDTQPFVWIDALTNSGLVGDDAFKLFDIGFSFKFYENTYTQLYASTNGLITFGTGSTRYTNQPIPQVGSPDNYIAPFWSELAVGAPWNSGHIDTLNGPDYFVVEWENVTRRGGSDLMTFEAILYANGDICTQYKLMQGTVNVATVGIEDPDGYDGLEYLYNEPGIGSLVNTKPLCFLRPGADARVKIIPPYQSSFIMGGESQFQVNLRNTGEEGTDTYDITTAVTGSPWTVGLYDMDGNSIVDTGPVDQGSSTSIVVKLQASSGAVAGDYAQVLLTARSSLNTAQFAQVTLQSAVPAPYTQLFADSETGMNFEVLQPDSLLSMNVIGNFTGNAQNMAALSEGFYFIVWERYSVGYSNIEYGVASSFGAKIVMPKALTENPQQTRDSSPLADMVPNGEVGVIWSRNILSGAGTNSNIYLAILTQRGDLLYGPVNITNNSGWYHEGVLNVPLFSETSIASTPDNRFVLSWVDARAQAAGNTTDVWFAIYNKDGIVIKNPTNATGGAPGEFEFSYPSLSGLTNNRALLVYSAHDLASTTYTVTYQILDSAGSSYLGPVSIAGTSGWNPDSSQLNNGKIMLAWTDTTSHQVNFATLNEDTYNIESGPTALVSPLNRYAANVSVTYDSAGHWILTWLDDTLNNYLYYALVDSSGTIVTPPMIFHSGQTTASALYLSNTGGGNAPYTAGRVWLPLLFNGPR